MSDVKWCDMHEGVFPVKEEDDEWSTYTITVRKRDKETGRRFQEQVVKDACSDCTRKVATKSQTALTGSVEPDSDAVD